MYFSQFVGVDISKNTLDAAIYPAKDKKLDFLHFDNTQKGLGEMLSWLKRRGVKPSEMVICAEHTGVYTNPLIAFAAKRGLALTSYFLIAPSLREFPFALMKGKTL